MIIYNSISTKNEVVNAIFTKISLTILYTIKIHSKKTIMTDMQMMNGVDNTATMTITRPVVNNHKLYIRILMIKQSIESL